MKYEIFLNKVRHLKLYKVAVPGFESDLMEKLRNPEFTSTYIMSANLIIPPQKSSHLDRLESCAENDIVSENLNSIDGLG